jgi:hypothetical protein
MTETNHNPFSLIQNKRLNNFEVLEIVREWYTEMCPDIFQNEEGADLEEWVEHWMDLTTTPEEKEEYYTNFTP